VTEENFRRSSFFVVGGTLRPDAPCYIEREADIALYEAILAKEYCYVLTSRQMGKSSLLAKTSKRLQQDGLKTVTLDLTTIGTETDSPNSWYYGITHKILRDLGIQENLEIWWNNHRNLPLVQRLIECFRDLILNRLVQQIVIFVDEIDSTITLPFTDDFFAAIRSCFNARALDNQFNRLTFVLLGVASPNDLIKDPTRTPFNIGQRINLTDFNKLETKPLVEAITDDLELQSRLLDKILFWTQGHPYLTQKLCDLISKSDLNEFPEQTVDQIVYSNFLKPESSRQEYNLSFVRDRLIKDSKNARKHLLLYDKILKGKSIINDPLSLIQTNLKLSGIVIPRDKQILCVRNSIYEQVFTSKWVHDNLPVDRVKLGIISSVVFFVIITSSFYIFLSRSKQIIVFDPKEIQVVDCLLPGQIRKLGRSMTYLTSRDPIKTTALDCEIRGGEYVANDRANYATSLQTWLPKAQIGDSEAQYQVGRIFDRGLGRAPDLNVAKSWYQKAADQGNMAAAVNLDRLDNNRRNPLSNLKKIIKKNEDHVFGNSISTEIDFGNYFALVIGVGRYDYLKEVKTAINDASAVTKVLADNYNFKVEFLENPKRSEIFVALNKYRQLLTEKDNLIIFFEGHGNSTRNNSEGYWAATDSRQNDLTSWVSNQEVTDLIDIMAAKHILIVASSFQTFVDSDTSILDIRSNIQDSQYLLSEMVRSRSRLILKSSDIEQPSSDFLIKGLFSNHLSVFTSSFVNTLTENREILPGQMLFSEMINKIQGLGVKDMTIKKLPEYGSLMFTSHEGSDFFFVPLAIPKPLNKN
jgi:hypothetical protein